MFVFVEPTELKLQGERMADEELDTAATADEQLAGTGETPP
jgi:hypothetical protein